MTRIQAKDVLISLGIEEPTDEAITNYLNSVNGEIRKERDKADQYKKDAERVEELQAKLDELNNANLSDIEKANKLTEEANNKVAELEKKINLMNTKNSLLSNGLSEEDANKLIESNFDASLLGEIIANKSKSAVADFEKQMLKGTESPNGSGGKAEPEQKTEMDKAVDLVKSVLTPTTSTTDVINAYK